MYTRTLWRLQQSNWPIYLSNTCWWIIYFLASTRYSISFIFFVFHTFKRQRNNFFLKIRTMLFWAKLVNQVCDGCFLNNFLASFHKTTCSVVFGLPLFPFSWSQYNFITFLAGTSSFSLKICPKRLHRRRAILLLRG